MRTPTVTDLSITKTNGVDLVAPGETVSWTITVSNHGPAAVSAAMVSDPIPPGVAGAARVCSATGGGVCTGSGSGDIATHITLSHCCTLHLTS